MSDTVNIDALRALLEKATPGPWYWAEDEQNARMKAHAKAHGYRFKPRDKWLALLHGRGRGCTSETHKHCDAFDHPWVFGLRWSSIRGETLINGRPEGADKDLIVALVNAAPALLDELAMRRQQVLDLGEDLNALEGRAERADGECARLREALDAIVNRSDRDYLDDDGTQTAKLYAQARAALAAQERAPLIAPFDSAHERNQTNP